MGRFWAMFNAGSFCRPICVFFLCLRQAQLWARANTCTHACVSLHATHEQGGKLRAHRMHTHVACVRLQQVLASNVVYAWPLARLHAWCGLVHTPIETVENAEKKEGGWTRFETAAFKR